MNYQRIYLLSFVGIGLLFGIQSFPTLLTDPSTSAILMAIGSGVMVVGGGYELFVSDDPTAPSEPNWQVFGAVLGFVLVAAGSAIQWLA